MTESDESEMGLFRASKVGDVEQVKQFIKDGRSVGRLSISFFCFKRILLNETKEEKLQNNYKKKNR